jgi:hypothetical protein
LVAEKTDYLLEIEMIHDLTAPGSVGQALGEVIDVPHWFKTAELRTVTPEQAPVSDQKQSNMVLRVEQDLFSIKISRRLRDG